MTTAQVCLLIWLGFDGEALRYADTRHYFTIFWHDGHPISALLASHRPLAVAVVNTFTIPRLSQQAGPSSAESPSVRGRAVPSRPAPETEARTPSCQRRRLRRRLTMTRAAAFLRPACRAYAYSRAYGPAFISVARFALRDGLFPACFNSLVMILSPARVATPRGGVEGVSLMMIPAMRKCQCPPQVTTVNEL